MKIIFVGVALCGLLVISSSFGMEDKQFLDKNYLFATLSDSDDDCFELNNNRYQICPNGAISKNIIADINFLQRKVKIIDNNLVNTNKKIIKKFTVSNFFKGVVYIKQNGFFEKLFNGSFEKLFKLTNEVIVDKDSLWHNQVGMKKGSDCLTLVSCESENYIKKFENTPIKLTNEQCAVLANIPDNDCIAFDGWNNVYMFHVSNDNSDKLLAVEAHRLYMRINEKNNSADVDVFQQLDSDGVISNIICNILKNNRYNRYNVQIQAQDENQKLEQLDTFYMSNFIREYW